MSKQRKDSNLDLRSALNAKCKKCKNREERSEFWENDLCRNAPSALDKLPIRCVGIWAYDKVFRLAQYFGIFSQGMRNKWDGLNYIEICSGPGRCVTRENGEEIDGTSLAIINHEKFDYLGKALFIDVNTEVVQILNRRIDALNASGKAKAVVGDYNDVGGILSEIRKLPTDNLNLLFVDPTECNVPFDTIQAIITELKNVDIIINVSIGTDVSRNIRRAVLEPAFAKTREKYERFLGYPHFFLQKHVLSAAKRNQPDVLRRLFVKTYQEKLAEYEYSYTDATSIRHYYYLLFASKHPKGLEFWLKACAYDPCGQKSLPGII